MQIQPFRSLLSSPFISRRLFDKQPADQSPELAQKLFRKADLNPVRIDPNKDDAVEFDSLKRKTDDISRRKEDGVDLLGKLAKRSLKGVEKLSDELEHAAFKQFKSHLRELEGLAKEFGVDPSDFREFIKDKLSALGIKDTRPIVNDRDSSLADSFSEGSFAAAFSSATSLQTSQSSSGFNIEAAVRESGAIAFDGDLQTKDGRSVHLSAAFEFDLSAEIEVGVNGSGFSVPGGKEPGHSENHGHSGEFDYGEVVGGLLARLKEFELKLRPPGKGRGGREDHENVERTPQGQQLAVNKSPNEPTDASPRLAGIAYNYQAERFQFDYFRLTASDGATTKSLEAYRSVSQSISTSFAAVIA